MSPHTQELIANGVSISALVVSAITAAYVVYRQQHPKPDKPKEERGRIS